MRSVLSPLLLPFLLGHPLSAAPPPDGSEEPILMDMAVTTAVLGHVNQTEAIVAFETYAQTYARAQGVPAEVDVRLFQDLAALRREAERGRLKVVGLQTAEYFQLREAVSLDLVFAGEKSGRIAERYAIIVRTDGGIEQLSDLRGKDFLTYSGTSMGFAKAWLDYLLSDAGLPAAGQFFASQLTRTKASQALLPVFFQKTDACLVAGTDFETMVEMNPQLGRQLRLLAQSPEIVPFVTCMRSDFTGANRDRTERAYLEADVHPLGQQALLLFGFDRMRRLQPDDLASAWRIYHTNHEQDGSEADE